MLKHSELPRDEDGLLPWYAWPGGYPIIYMSRCGACLCPSCANKEDELVDSAFIHYAGHPVECEECEKAIESQYGPEDEGEVEDEQESE